MAIVTIFAARQLDKKITTLKDYNLPCLTKLTCKFAKILLDAVKRVALQKMWIEQWLLIVKRSPVEENFRVRKRGQDGEVVLKSESY